jgi:hypothetical protein
MIVWLDDVQKGRDVVCCAYIGLGRFVMDSSTTRAKIVGLFQVDGPSITGHAYCMRLLPTKPNRSFGN